MHAKFSTSHANAYGRSKLKAHHRAKKAHHQQNALFLGVFSALFYTRHKIRVASVSTSKNRPTEIDDQT